MAEGNVLKSIIKFAFPCILIRLIQNLYPLLDSAIAGRLLDLENLSAIGVSGSLYSLFNEMLVGLVSGFAIVASKKYGEKNNDDVRSVYMHSFLISIFLCLVISFLGICFSEQMLLALKTPVSILKYAKQYLFVMFLGFLPNALYNFFCEMIRALGDSKKTFYLLVVSSVFHFLLLVPFTKAFAISGTALASVTSYLLTDLLAAILIAKKFPVFKIRVHRVAIEKSIMKECFSIGFPMLLTNFVTMLGVLLLNRITNAIGADYIAAYACASKIGYVITTPIFGFAASLAVFTSQNYGAREFSRIKEGIRKTMRLVLALDMALLLFSMLLSKSVLYLILGENETAIRAGMLYLTIRCCAMFILTPAAIYKSVLPAIGKPFFSTLSSFIEVGIRFLFPMLFANLLGFASVPLTDAFTWLVLAIFLALAYHLEFQKKC